MLICILFFKSKLFIFRGRYRLEENKPREKKTKIDKVKANMDYKRYRPAVFPELPLGPGAVTLQPN